MKRLFIFAIIYSLPLFAGNNSAVFNDLMPGGEACLYAGAYASLAEDAFGIYYNPAFKLQANKLEVSILQNNAVMNVNTLGIGLHLNDNYSVAFMVANLSSDNLTYVDAFGNTGGKFLAGETGIIGGLSYNVKEISRLLNAPGWQDHFFKFMSIGLNIKLWRQFVGASEDLSWDIGLGIRGEEGKWSKIKYGFVFDNILGIAQTMNTVKNDGLPFTFKAGLSHNIRVKDVPGQLSFAVDFSYIHNKDINFNIGTKYLFYKYFGAGIGISNTKALMSLLGRYKFFHFVYSLQFPFSSVDSSLNFYHRINIGIRFDTSNL